jgi:hypothetical protein
MSSRHLAIMQEEAANMHMDWKAEKGTVIDNNDGTYTARYTQTKVRRRFATSLCWMWGRRWLTNPFTARYRPRSVRSL